MAKFIFVAGCSIFCLPSSLPATTKGLYGSAENVIQPSPQDFSHTILDQPHAWVVEFYASWCGHCQQFAPFYTQFANEIEPWSDWIKVAAIDCGQTSNSGVCERYEITGYPTVKYFPPGAVAGEVGERRESWEKSVESLKYDTIDYLVKIRKDLNLTTWPNLDPVLEYGNGGAVLQLIRRDKSLKSLVVIEGENSYVGQETILNTYKWLSPTQTLSRAVANEPTQTQLEKINFRDLPILAVIDPDKQDISIVKSNSTASDLQQAVLTFYLGPGYQTKVHTSIDDEKTGHEKTASNDLKRRRYTTFLSDLEKTVVYSLVQEVAHHPGPLSPDQLAAAGQFVTVLAAFFPENSRLLPLLARTAASLSGNLDAVKQVIAANLNDLLREEYDRREWMACRGSDPKFGGYPCGMWMVFHTLTVNQLLLDGDNANGSTVVLDAMQVYIQQFFGCRECADHFTRMVRGGARVEEEVESVEDAVVFLWQIHNEVNQRLQKDATDDPVYPKSYFPSVAYCPTCYNQQQAGNYVRPEVVKFLTQLYSAPESHVTTTSTSTSSSSTFYTSHLCLLLPILGYLFIT